jgi:hypothetical protein
MERYFNLFLFALLLAFGTVSMGCDNTDTDIPEGDADADADADTDTDTDADADQVNARVVVSKSLSFMNVQVNGTDVADDNCTDDECAQPVTQKGTYTVTASCDECRFATYDVDIQQDGDNTDADYTMECAGGLAPNGVYVDDVYGREHTVESSMTQGCLLMDGLNNDNLLVTGNKFYRQLDDNQGDPDDTYAYGAISDDLRTITFSLCEDGVTTNTFTFTLIEGAVRSTEE